MLPGQTVEPAVVPGTAFGAVFAFLVNDRRAGNNGFEAGGFPLDKAGHLASVAVAHEDHAGGVDRVFRDDRVDAGHDVTIVSAAEVIVVGCDEFPSVAGAAPGIWLKDRPSMAEEELVEYGIIVDPCAGGTAVYIDNERHLPAGGGFWRQRQAAFQVEAAIRPAHNFRMHGCPWLGNHGRRMQGYRLISEPRSIVQRCRGRAAGAEPDPASLCGVGFHLADNRHSEVEDTVRAAAHFEQSNTRANLNGLQNAGAGGQRQAVAKRAGKPAGQIGDFAGSEIERVEVAITWRSIPSALRKEVEGAAGLRPCTAFYGGRNFGEPFWMSRIRNVEQPGAVRGVKVRYLIHTRHNRDEPIPALAPCDSSHIRRNACGHKFSAGRMEQVEARAMRVVIDPYSVGLFSLFFCFSRGFGVARRDGDEFSVWRDRVEGNIDLYGRCFSCSGTLDGRYRVSRFGFINWREHL